MRAIAAFILLLARERPDVGHVGKDPGEAVEQTETVLPYSSVAVHDQNILEESVDGASEFGESATGPLVITIPQRFLHIILTSDACGEQRGLRLAQQALVDVSAKGSIRFR